MGLRKASSGTAAIIVSARLVAREGSPRLDLNQIYPIIANNYLTGTAASNLLWLSALDVSHDPQIILQGFVEDGPGVEDGAVITWNANGNAPGANTSNIFVSLDGAAIGSSAGTAQTPTNPLPCGPLDTTLRGYGARRSAEGPAT